MNNKLLLLLQIVLLLNICIAQETNKIDCGVSNHYEHLEFLSEDKLTAIAQMRSYPPLYHRNGVAFQAADKDLDGFDFHNLSFPVAHFFRSSLEEANFQKSRVIGTIFTSANLQKANLQDMDAHSADFSLADLCQANLARANLRGASLVGTNLRYSTLHFANLAMTDMTRVDLTGADLTGAVLVGTILDTRTVTVEQLSKVASLYNIVLTKQSSDLHVIDTAMLKTLRELHPHLFDDIPMYVWFMPSRTFSPDMIQNWYYSK